MTWRGGTDFGVPFHSHHLDAFDDCCAWTVLGGGGLGFAPERVGT